MIEELSLVLPVVRAASFQVELAAMVDTYSAILFRVAHAVLRNRSEAEDVVQDVFVRVIEHQGSLPAVRDLRVWLVRIAWNLAVDRRRRIRPDQIDELFAAALTARDIPADIAFDQARHTRRVLAAIQKLPAAERQALLLAALEELETAEIAAIMQKTESAIRALLFRARSRLRTRLNRGGKA